MKAITKREIRNELFGILAMCDGFLEPSITGGARKDEMIKYLPKMIGKRIMELQDLIEKSEF